MFLGSSLILGVASIVTQKTDRATFSLGKRARVRDIIPILEHCCNKMLYIPLRYRGVQNFHDWRPGKENKRESVSGKKKHKIKQSLLICMDFPGMMIFRVLKDVFSWTEEKEKWPALPTKSMTSTHASQNVLFY